MYILGIVTGLLISLVIIAITLWQKPKIERVLNQTQSKLKEKGKIIEPEDELYDEFITNLPEK